MKTEIRSEFVGSRKVLLDCGFDPITGEALPPIVKQADKDACDINNIMRRYEASGQLPDMIRSDPRYGDFSSVPSFQESLEIVARAEEQFMALPAAVRDRFGHDPARMLAFCSDPRNSDEMVKLGLALPKTPGVANGGSTTPPVQAPAPAPAEPKKEA